MGINRFTKYTAPEFIQSYDPYPVQQMMGLAQHQQRRFDQIDTAIGKAYSDAVIKPGLSVEGRRTAAAVNKERKEQLDNLVNDFYENRNVRGAVRGLSELSSNWKNDSRADFVNADRELMKPVLNQTGQEGYGDYTTHKAFNRTTGEYTLGLNDDQIAAGQLPTMGDYGMMSNPGSSAAFKTYIDPVKDVLTQGMTRDAEGNIVTQDGKRLDAKRFLDKVGGDIDKLSSDGWNIDQPSDADPNTQKFIKWRQMEFANQVPPRIYTIADFKNDFLTEAEKYTHDSEKIKVTKGKGLESAIGESTTPMFPVGTQTTSPVRNQILSKEYHEGGLDAFMEKAGFSDITPFFESIVNPDSKTGTVERDKLIKENVNKQYEGKFFNDKGEPIGSNRYVKGDGTVAAIQSKEDIEKIKQERVKQVSGILDKAFYFRQEALNSMSSADREKIQFNEDGSYELTPEAKKAEEERIKNGFEALGITWTAEGVSEAFKADIPREERIIKMGEALGNIYNVNPNVVGVGVIGKVLRGLGKGSKNALEELSDFALSFSDSPITKMQQLVDSEIKEHYGNRSYANPMIHLQDKGAIDITSQVDPEHQRLAAEAITKAKSGLAFAVSGKQIGRDDLEDVENMVENGIDFRDGVFDPDYIEFDMVGKEGMKVYATGNMTKNIASGENKGNNTSGKQYQVDITEEFFNSISNNEATQLLYQDAVLDAAYDLIPNGQDKQSVYLNTKKQKEAEEYLGGEGAMISKYVDPQTGQKLYNITGKVPMFDPDTNEVKIIDADTYKDPVSEENIFKGLSQKQMIGMSREIASTLPYILQSTDGSSMTPAEQAAVNAEGIEYSDVDSFDVGAFGLNTKSNGSAARQVQIGFASNMQAADTPVDMMSANDQIDYSSYLFVNGGNGWNEWGVTKRDSSGNFENDIFTKSLRVLKGLDENNPGEIVQALKSNSSTLNISKVDPNMIVNIMSEFKSNVLQTKSNGNYSVSDIATSNNIPDSLVAIAVAIAETGLNSNAIDVNQK
jgi:hypothetical protein